ncbi:MAG: lamin tail domain-containing protein [Chitinophagaceae bacterium]|nr:lamin tail domain-containing protein [Chitinophagaceae bacterium]
MKRAVISFCLFYSVALFTQNRYDVVIDEIMADPTPQVGLPNYEWIEIKNVSSSPVNLQNWRIGDASGQSGALPPFILQPDSFVIVCSGSALAAMSAFGQAVSVTNFPSLDNDGDQIFLRAASGRILHAVEYQISWYQNELKKDGGWSLEMIDPRNPCAGMSNWKASVHPNGGTPGKRNSVDGTLTDNQPPSLLRTYTVNAQQVVAVFDEPLDSTMAAMAANYTLNGGITVTQAVVLSPLFDKVQLTLSAPLQPQTVYEITAANIRDCKGNSIGTRNKAKAGLPQPPEPADMVINEILFNPKPNAEDYVEFYNKSKKILDASRLYVANRNSINAIANTRALSAAPWLIFPDDFIVITSDAVSLQREYFVKHPDRVLPLSSLPTFPDDKGFVILLDQQGAVLDEVNYHKKWHFRLIDNDEGVALERIDPNGPSQDPNNWTSAASTSGYGTPTSKNSQYKLIEPIRADVQISPKVFSPDNDGRDDIATIQFKVSEPGYVANVTIYDASGRPVRHLVRNSTLGISGYWNWDGLDDKGQKLPIGNYIVFTEIFNLRGQRQGYKNAVVLAGRL